MSKRLLRSLLSLMVCMAMLLSLAPAALAESADAPSTEMAVGAVIHGFGQSRTKKEQPKGRKRGIIKR